MIEVHELTKTYGDLVAVNRVSFKIDRGEIVGLLGPNGAGKTTTIRVLTTFLAPTAGRLTVAGHDVEKDPLEVRRKLGYLPESAPLYEDMRVRDYLRFVADARRVPRTARHARISYVADHCGLRGVMGRPISELSKGYRQRVGLAQALVHDPEIVVLDEPTSGLDPNQIVEIRNLIRDIGRQKTVILSTHILQEVAALCSRIIVIHRGKIVADGSQAGLREQADKESVFFIAVEAEPAEVAARLGAVQGVKAVEKADGEALPGFHRFRLLADKSADIAPRLHQCVTGNKWRMSELSKLSVTLEDVFRKLTRDE
ncbi:MAG: ATP-binding cassette domain-containing protein [Planctomycetota bacterium]|nr:ATP-binding cassette domain-containing protein [Planctomycetota bacterium]